MLQVEPPPKEICVTILITCAPLLQLHPWLISFSPFKFISNDLYVTKLGQVWKEVSSSVNCFRQWCAENSELYVNRSNCDSFALSISLSLFSLASHYCFFLTLCFSGTQLHTSSTPFLLAHGKLSEVETKQKGLLSSQGSRLMSNTFLSLPSSVHLLVSLLKCRLYRPPLPGQ